MYNYMSCVLKWVVSQLNIIYSKELTIWMLEISYIYASIRLGKDKQLLLFI